MLWGWEIYIQIRLSNRHPPAPRGGNRLGLPVREEFDF